MPMNFMMIPVTPDVLTRLLALRYSDDEGLGEVLHRVLAAAEPAQGVISIGAVRQARTLPPYPPRVPESETPDLTQRARKRRHAQRMLAFAEGQLHVLRQNKRHGSE